MDESHSKCLLEGQPRVKNELLVFTTLYFNYLGTTMNTTMFNVAIPNIAAEFSLSVSQSSLIVTIYSIVLAIGTVTYGRLSDRFHIKTLLTFGLSLLGVGSLIGLISSSFYFIVFARLLQAAGASSILGLGMVLIAKVIIPQRRGFAMGRISSAATLGIGLGPLLGGVITAYFGWNFLFLVTILGVFMIPIYRIYLPLEKPNGHSFDIIGLLLLVLGWVSALLSLLFLSILFMGMTILFWALFWYRIGKISNPFIQKKLLTNKQYWLLLLFGFLCFFSNTSLAFIIPMLLADLFHLKPNLIGLIVFPGAISSALLSFYIGHLLDKKGFHIVTRYGVLGMLVAILLLSSFGFYSIFFIGLCYMIYMIGFSTVYSGNPKLLSDILPLSDIGVGMGMLQLTQYFGGAFGVTVTGLLLDSLGNPQPINLFWIGQKSIYSDTFLFLALIAFITKIILTVIAVKKRENKSLKGSVHVNG